MKLDDYKKAIERAVTVKASNIERVAEESEAEKAALKASGAKFWQIKNSGKSYIALGMLTGIKEIRTQKGATMAFAKLNDYDGQIDLTFFPDTWASLKPQLEDAGIYAFKGKVDGSRETPSLIVDSIENASELENQALKAVHVMLDNSFTDVVALSDLKNFLFEKNGNCSVYFHIRVGNNPFVIKANDQISISASDEILGQLRDINFVKEVWTE